MPKLALRRVLLSSSRKVWGRDTVHELFGSFLTCINKIWLCVCVEILKADKRVKGLELHRVVMSCYKLALRKL